MIPWLGGYWEYDTECDCPLCSDWRDTHCPKCGDLWPWDGETEASRVCGSCQADAAELYIGENYKPGHSSDFPF